MSGKTIYPPVHGATLRYARETSGYALAEVQRRFPDIMAWEDDKARPTMAEAKALAKFYKRTLLFFYLRKIPEELVRADRLPRRVKSGGHTYFRFDKEKK